MQEQNIIVKGLVAMAILLTLFAGGCALCGRTEGMTAFLGLAGTIAGILVKSPAHDNKQDAG